MSNTAVSSSPAPAQTSGAAASTRAGHAGKKSAGEDAAPGGIFASLLALVGATHGAPTETPTVLAGDADQGEANDAGQAQDNPFLAMLGWLPPAASPVLAPDAGAAPGVAELAGDLAAGTADASLTAAPDQTLADAAAAIDTDDALLQGMKPVKPESVALLPVMPPKGAEATTALSASPAPAQVEQAPGAKPAASAVVAAQDASSRNASAGSAQAATTPPPGTNWRNAASSGVLIQRAANQQGDSLRGKTTTSLSQGRSTVDLNDRYGVSKALEAVTPAQNGNPLAGSAQDAVVQRPGAIALAAQDAGASALAAGGPDIREPAQREVAQKTDPTQSADLQPGATDGELEVNTWGTQNLRHASLRVTDGAREAIDVRLSLSGQEVHVDFRTDSAEARASLQHSANQSLGDMLQRSGIQLGGVSVGAQGQSQERAPDQRSGNPNASRGDAQGTASEAAQTPSAPRPRADGSRPVDLFV